MKKSGFDRAFDICLGLIMLLIIVVTLYPIYYSLIFSLNSGYDIDKNGLIFFIPRVFTLDNYKMVFDEKQIVNAFIVTTARTVIGTVTSVLFTAMVAYPLSKKYLLFRSFYMKTGIVTMYFYGGLIPFYLLLRDLGLIDKFLVFIIPTLFSFFNVAIFISFFSQIPDALEESAMIDGANDLYIFVKIVLPLSMPVLATISLFNGVSHWNAWFDAAFFTNGDKYQTLQLFLWKIIAKAKGAQVMAKIVASGKINMSLLEAMKYSTIIISIIPIACVYPLLQRYFVKGMMIGSIKG